MCPFLQRLRVGWGSKLRIPNSLVAPEAPSDFYVMFQEPPEPYEDLILIWTDNSENETGFQLEGRTTEPIVSEWNAIGEMEYFPDYSVPANTTSYVVTAAVEYTWQYRIRSVNAAGPSDWIESNEITLLAQPTDAVAIQIDESTIRVTWTDVSTLADRVDINRSVNGGFYDNFTTRDPGVETADDNELEPDHTYQYSVRATANEGSATSDDAESNEVDQYLAQPATVTATQYTTTKANVSWTDSSSWETGYEIQRSDNGAAFAALYNAAANATTYQDTNVVVGNTYQYKVSAMAANYASVFTSSLGLTATYLYGYPTKQATEAGVVGQWLLNEASANIADAITSTQYQLRYGPITAYNVAATGVWAGVSPGITFPGSGIFGAFVANGSTNANGCPVSHKIGTADIVIEAVGSIAGPAPGAEKRMGIYGQRAETTGGYVVLLPRGTSDTNMYFGIRADDGTVVDAAMACSNVATNTIKKFRAYFDRNGNKEYFIDGVSQGTISITALDGKAISGSGNVSECIGDSYRNGSTPFYGTLYEVRLTLGNIAANSGGPGGG